MTTAEPKLIGLPGVFVAVENGITPFRVPLYRVCPSGVIATGEFQATRSLPTMIAAAGRFDAVAIGVTSIRCVGGVTAAALISPDRISGERAEQAMGQAEVRGGVAEQRPPATSRRLMGRHRMNSLASVAWARSSAICQSPLNKNAVRRRRADVAAANSASSSVSIM